jgi:hypothetical protein
VSNARWLHGCAPSVSNLSGPLNGMDCGALKDEWGSEAAVRFWDYRFSMGVAR